MHATTPYKRNTSGAHRAERPAHRSRHAGVEPPVCGPTTLILGLGLISVMSSFLFFVGSSSASVDTDGAASQSQLQQLQESVRQLQYELAAAAQRDRANTRVAEPEDSLKKLHSQLQSMIPPSSPAPSMAPPAFVVPQARVLSANVDVDQRQAAGRHPFYRLAFVVPWLGPSFPSWFGYFVASCAKSDYIADWLIFHENAQAKAILYTLYLVLYDG